jgi:hypothetical protein
MDHQSIKYPKQIEIDHANLRAPFHGSGICAMAANNDEPLFFISYCPVVTGPVKRVLNEFQCCKTLIDVVNATHFPLEQSR